jgi:hypothetical protein
MQYQGEIIDIRQELKIVDERVNEIVSPTVTTSEVFRD